MAVRRTVVSAHEEMKNTPEELYLDLMELPPDRRLAELERLTPANPDLREEVIRLLADAEAADGYFSSPPAVDCLVPSRGVPVSEVAGDWVGPFRLIRKLGEGGFGMVWEAEQLKPIKRVVAVKILKAGMDSEEVLARFAAERQALARMEHENIARVLDAGATSNGRPFFAMELAEGFPINEFCRESNLTTRQTLELFKDVCSAVNHAHQKGVIHRDLKPSNILVVNGGSKPAVKVIDFGIAKAIEGRLTDETLRTRMTQWLGTPVYMSPEQAGGDNLDIDTRTDIYSLGVILYELLAGAPPFDQETLHRAGYDEMRRIIREVEPSKPSERITTLSARKAKDADTQMKVGAGHERRAVPAELDWVVMKAIEKARERRYESAAALAEDISRFLGDEPVAARPPTPGYLLLKFAKRHRMLIRSMAAVLVVLALTTAFSIYQAIRARNAEAAANLNLEKAVTESREKEKALEEARTVSSFFAAMFKQAAPESGGRKITVLEALQKTGAKMNQELEQQPANLSLIKSTLAETYHKLGMDSEAAAALNDALVIRRKMLGKSHKETLGTLRKLIETQERLRNFSEVMLLAAQEDLALRTSSGERTKESIIPLQSMAEAAFLSGDPDKARAVQSEILRLAARFHGNASDAAVAAQWYWKRYQNPPLKPNPLENIKRRIMDDSSKLGGRRRPEMEELIRKYESALQGKDANDPAMLELRLQIGKKLPYSGLRDEAPDYMSELLDDCVKTLGPHDGRSLECLSAVSGMYYHHGFKEKGIEYGRRLVNLLTETEPGRSVKLRGEEDMLLRRMFYTNWEERISFGYDVIKRRSREFGADSHEVATVEIEQSLCLGGVKRYDEATKAAEHCIPILTAHEGRNSRGTAYAIANLARCYAAGGKSKEAVKLLAECCPNMQDDTYVAMLLAALQVWFRDHDGYGKTRDMMIQYGVGEAGGGMPVPNILRRIVHLASLEAFSDKRQIDVLKSLLNAADEAEARQSVALDTRNRKNRFIEGLYYLRAGDLRLALNLFDQRRAELEGASGVDLVMERLCLDFYKSVALCRDGRKAEAEAVFRQARDDNRWWQTSENEPLLNYWMATGEIIELWLSFREAAKELGLDPMVEQRKSVEYRKK